MKLKTMLSLSALTLLLAGCCMFCSSKSETFTDADSGKTFTASPGSTLTLDLKGNYTTGYSWNIVSYDKSIIKLSDSRYTTDNTGLAGAPGVQQYVFNIIGKGETELKITYNRVWEKDVEPAQIFSLKVVSK